MDDQHMSSIPETNQADLPLDNPTLFSIESWASMHAGNNAGRAKDEASRALSGGGVPDAAAQYRCDSPLNCRTGRHAGIPSTAGDQSTPAVPYEIPASHVFQTSAPAASCANSVPASEFWQNFTNHVPAQPAQATAKRYERNAPASASGSRKRKACAGSKEPEVLIDPPEIAISHPVNAAIFGMLNMMHSHLAGSYRYFTRTRAFTAAECSILPVIDLMRCTLRVDDAIFRYSLTVRGVNLTLEVLRFRPVTAEDLSDARKVIALQYHQALVAANTFYMRAKPDGAQEVPQPLDTDPALAREKPPVPVTLPETVAPY